MTQTPSIANAFASTFYFLQTHKSLLKNKKSLQSNAQGSAKNQCKLDITTLRTDRGHPLTSYIKHLAVSALSSISARIKSTCNLTGRCFGMPNVSYT